MIVNHISSILRWAICLSFATVSFASLNSDVQIRNAPGVSSGEILQILGRALHLVKRDTVYRNSTILDRSWNGATLFKLVSTLDTGASNVVPSLGIEIVCTTCYVKGTATAQFTIAGNFNASQAFRNFTAQVKDDVQNVSSEVIDFVGAKLENFITELVTPGDVDFPPVPFHPDIRVPVIPECLLTFEFDGLELYMELDTTLTGGASYTFPIFVSQTPLGFSAGKELNIGVIFTIDLLLSVEAAITIRSGFHIELKESLVLNLPMFGKNVSSIKFNGGKFEFLPVTIQSAGVVLKALLRVGAQAGIEAGIQPKFELNGHTLGASAGVKVGVWADIADLTTNVTAAPSGDSSGCALRVQEVFSMAIGATAGASVAIDTHTWGPTPNTSIPIFYTTFIDACAVSTTTTLSAPVTARAVQTGLTTTTITSKITYTGTACLIPGLLHCPVANQTTSKNTVTSTLVTSVPSGVKATFPATIQTSIASTIAFGKNMKQMSAAESGTPTSFVPPTGSSTNGISGFTTKETGGVSNRIIIGVSVGLGLPVLIAIIACAIFYYMRKRRLPEQRGEVVDQGFQQTTGPYTVPDKKGPQVSVIQN